MEPKFTLNREKISDEEINKHKDFDKLVKQFKQQSIQKAKSDNFFLKNKKVTYASVIAGVTVICTLTYFTVFKNKNLNTNDDKTLTQNNNNTNTTNATKPNSAFIAPPSKKLDVPYSTYKVNAQRGGELAHTTNSKLKVPKSAFVNREGKEIVGEVEIRYREFHNQADIIASGIPMTYDSAGTRYTFESAGMFDIKGYQNGEPVFIAPNKTIDVELASLNSGNQFNQYILDTIAKNWKCLKKDTPKQDQSTSDQPIVSNEKHSEKMDETTSPKIKSITKRIEVIPKQIDSVKTVYTKKINLLPQVIQPAKPQKANPSRQQFELDVDYKEFPELAAFKSAVFEVGDENKAYANDLSKITWSSAIISEGPQKGKNYLLTLTLRKRVEKLIVYPALSGANYETAMKQYEKRFSEYNNLLVKREADEKKLRDEMETKQKMYIEEQKKLSAELLRQQVRIRQEMEKVLEEQYASASNNLKVVRTFNINNFGIFNSDHPCGRPIGATLDPIYISHADASVMTPNNIYLVEHGKNIVFSLNYGDKITYDPSKDYSLCILANGGIYLCDKKDFAYVISSKQNRIAVKPLEGAETPADLKKALGI